MPKRFSTATAFKRVALTLMEPVASLRNSACLWNWRRRFASCRFWALAVPLDTPTSPRSGADARSFPGRLLLRAEVTVSLLALGALADAPSLLRPTAPITSATALVSHRETTFAQSFRQGSIDSQS